MKKETIFRHELNESIQADAAMSCLKNRNKQMNEAAPLVAGVVRLAMPLLKPVIKKVVANLVSKMGAKMITGSRLISSVMSKLNSGTIAKVAQKIGQTWTEVPEELKQEIWSFAAQTLKEYLSKEKIQSQEQEEDGINKGGMHNLVQVGHIMNTPSEFDEDDDFDWVYDAACDIINTKFTGKSLVEIAPDQVKDDIRAMIMKKYKISPKNAEEHHAWVRNIELAFDYATNYEFENQEQEELPSMERKDMILALAEYMAESWIDTGDDGDLDDIYYAIVDILDKTGDYPASTDWEDCKPWCQKHYKEVEARIY